MQQHQEEEEPASLWVFLSPMLWDSSSPTPSRQKIDAHLEQQRRKVETSPSGGAAVGATAPALIVIKSVWQRGIPAAVSQDAWKERSRAPAAFSEASQGVAGADTGKEGYLH